MGTTTIAWAPVFDCVTHELDENNNVKAEYHNEPQPYGGVLSQRRGTTTHYHHHDALGSTRFLTDSSGNVTDTYLHDAWGNLVASTGTTINPFKWVGKYGYYTDNSTTQVYVRARMYQRTTARWVSFDPLFNLSPHAYSRQSPVQRIDPSGLKCKEYGDGIHYVPGRGTFDVVASPGSFANQDELSLDIAIFFKSNIGEFLSREAGCQCCCDKIGFVQIVRVDWEPTNAVVIMPGSTVFRGEWEIDAGEELHYPYFNAINRSPCNEKNWHSTMNDRPSVPLQGRTWGGIPLFRRLFSAGQEFETCAVCLCGEESPRFTESSRLHNFATTTMYIYGCIRWFHRHHSPDGYQVDRSYTVGRETRSKTDNDNGQNDNGYSDGINTTHILPAAPSQRFISLVKDKIIVPTAVTEYNNCEFPDEGVNL